jgi:hypothetical protein
MNSNYEGLNMGIGNGNDDDDAKQWGGARIGAGRKTESEDGEPMKARSIRMTDAEWQKCLELGGSQWIRDRIKRAKPKEGDRKYRTNGNGYAHQIDD